MTIIFHKFLKLLHFTIIQEGALVSS